MSTTPTTTKGITTSSTHHRGHRLRNFILPDGRKVHIALSPDEADKLRRRLNAIQEDEPFDLVISGSPEHLEALRRAHSHHEERRQALKTKHGDTYDEFENVRSELDVLGSELHMLTDHAVALDANFSKYGYSAHLRTYNEGSTPGSSASSTTGRHDMDHEKKDWEAERRNGRIMKIYKKPTVRQYFHKGLIWRASETTEVASFELFVDLLYVGIIAINGDHTSEDATGHELLRFTITFIMSWKIWNDLTLMISWFETDDILQRISVLFVMACLLGLTTNMLDALGETYSQLVAFYLAARLFMGSYYLFLAGAIPMVRGMMVVQALIMLIPSILWIGSIYISLPNRLAIIFIALVLDFCASMFVIFLIRASKHISSKLGAWIDRVFEFYPATNIEHKVERTNAFVTLVFGYSVVAIIYQNAASFGLNAFFGKAVLGLVQAFCFNWVYFELDGADLYSHAIRRTIPSGIIPFPHFSFFTSVYPQVSSVLTEIALLWTTMHVPFVMAFVLAAGSLSKLVLAIDCPDTSLSDLTSSYALKSTPQISMGLRWFYCGGLGVSLFSMGIISICHIHKENSVRLTKKYRMINRLGVFDRCGDGVGGLGAVVGAVGLGKREMENVRRTGGVNVDGLEGEKGVYIT
ncbi:hypothetical protein B7494_g3044 [Chlorociboria aeruginascens]|nr:hypothetical protein B7494_g3044 [Chlorociboria aeruginascens]